MSLAQPYGSAGRLRCDRFPLASKYSEEWQTQFFFGPNSLWLAEFAIEACPIRPGARVLDLGCGAGLTSVFLAKEFGATVYALDQVLDSARLRRLARSCGVAGQVIPVEADARRLPFAAGSFDVVLALSSYSLFGADEHYLPYLAGYLTVGGRIALVQPGHVEPDDEDGARRHFLIWYGKLIEEHPLGWWLRMWRGCPEVTVEVADHLPDGWRYWLTWDQLWLETGDFGSTVDTWTKAFVGDTGKIAIPGLTAPDVPHALREVVALETNSLRRDAGRTFAINRLVARRNPVGEGQACG
jgi:SAM-dependent methyltransferase